MKISMIMLGLIVIIALSSGVEAKNTLNTWVYSGDSIRFQSQDYFFFLNTNNNGVMVQSDDYRQLISLGQCHEHNFIQTCFKEVALDDFKYIKHDTAGNPFYGMRIEMNVTGPQITMTSTFNRTTIDIGERAVGIITVKNTGNRQAESIRLEGNVTPGTVIEACSECIIRGSTFVWTLPSLNVDNERQISIRLRAVTADDIGTTIRASYQYREQVGNTTFNSASIKMIKPYETRLTHKQQALVGETIRSEVSIKNVGSQPLTISARLIRENDVSYDGTVITDLIKNAPITLAPNEEKKYTISLRSDKTGSYDSRLNLTLTRDDKQYNESLNLRIAVSATDIDIILGTGKKSVIGGDTDMIELELRNTKTLGFRNINIIASGFFERRDSLDSLDPGQRKRIFYDSIIYPDDNERKDVTTNVTITYQTPFGETKRIEREVKVAVYPLRLAYDIDRSIEPKNPAVGEQFTVIVKGRKAVDSRVDIDLISDILVGAVRVSGSTSGPAKFTTQYEPLYSYTAQRTSENMTISASGFIRFGARTADFAQEYVAPIPPKKEEQLSGGNGETDEKTGNGGTTLDPRDVSIRKDDKSTGAFMDRIAAWVKNLFAGLFGRGE
jgi:hypothetical protein